MDISDQGADRAKLARLYADAILRDPLADPRSVEMDRSEIAPAAHLLGVRLRWIVLMIAIVIGVTLIWA